MSHYIQWRIYNESLCIMAHYNDTLYMMTHCICASHIDNESSQAHICNESLYIMAHK